MGPFFWGFCLGALACATVGYTASDGVDEKVRARAESVFILVMFIIAIGVSVPSMYNRSRWTLVDPTPTVTQTSTPLLGR